MPMTVPIIDSHVHFWDPTRIEYPWLEELPTLRRSFSPAAYTEAMRDVPLEGLVFVEANPRPDLAMEEVRFVEELAGDDGRLQAMVAFVNMLDSDAVPRMLAALAGRPLVRGIRHNIQGNPPGFATRTEVIEGVREAGRRGLTFDLCATHDQLPEVIELATRADETRMVLDHCGKPAIRDRGWEPWATHIRELAALPHLFCKISGLLTEANAETWRQDEILRYASHVAECFGPDRVMYGSDWPVLTLAERSEQWYGLMLELTAGWSDSERRRFFNQNARRFYGF